MESVEVRTTLAAAVDILEFVVLSFGFVLFSAFAFCAVGKVLCTSALACVNVRVEEFVILNQSPFSLQFYIYSLDSSYSASSVP